MKKFLIAIMFGLMAIAAQAEATFDQIEGLIQQQNYSAAAAGLETIIQNHPKSAKAFYAMAQAQAGMGNLEKARKALDIATGLNPTLDFAPASAVASLRQAITPQTAKIEAVETSHVWRNFAYFALFAGFAVACYFLYSVYARKQDEEAEASRAEAKRKLDEAREERQRQAEAIRAQQAAEQQAAQDALKAHPNYGHERFDPANPDKLKTVKQFKAEQKAQAESLARITKMREEESAAQALREANARAERAEEDARRARSYTQPTTVVQSGGGVGDFATGMILGNMMSSHHHDTERTVIRETVREVPAPSRSSSWDDDSSSRSSSRSSSWDDDSSSKSSSSWSSSSSDSSSSWSSSSDSSSSSSSSWD